MSTQDPFIGQVVGGRYEVVARIGRGAMGAIYEVRHTKLKRSFALKRLMPHLADDKEALERFQQEADVVAGLRHPNVVEIVDWETLPDGTPCIVMELLRGENLEQRMRRVGKLSWPELFSIADQVLSALVVAHRAGIVHRDLKPQNIYLTRDDTNEERVKLLDFGISKVQGVSQTSAGAVIGTPAYMAPEQADSRNDEISAATDLWAMGAILYELATGTQAFNGVSASAVLYKVCYGKADEIRRADTPAGFDTLVDHLLQKPVKERLADAEELRRMLKAIAAGEPVERRPPSLPSLPSLPSIPSIADRTVVDVAPSAPAHTTTTLSRSTGESVEIPVAPSAASAPGSARRLLPWAALGVLVLAGVVITLRPAQPPTEHVVQPAVAPPPLRVESLPIEPPVVPKPTVVAPKPKPKPVVVSTPKPVTPPPTVRPVRKIVKKPHVARPPDVRPLDIP